MEIENFEKISHFEHRFMVCVECFTYNHSSFIEDTLRGFCIQKTIRPFVCIVCDDDSTDGEQQTIKEYLYNNFELEDNHFSIESETNDYNFIFARHKTNQNCFFAVYLLKYNHYNKRPKRPYFSNWYEKSDCIASCEGDDYWTDSMKLQVQYDFLVEHPEYSFCCHRYRIFDQKSNRFLKEYGYNYYKEGENLVINEELFLKVWVTQTLSTMIMTDKWNKMLEKRSPYKYARDVHIYYLLLQEGNGISLNREMGVYRWHDGGVAIGQSSKQRYSTGFNLYDELWKNNPSDSLLITKILYNGIRLLRVSRYDKEARDLMRYLFTLTKSKKVRANIFLSFCVPSDVYVSLEKTYSSFRLKRKEMK